MLGGDRKIGRKRPIFKMAAQNKCEGTRFALVLKWPFHVLNIFFSKNEQDILVPWHPFDANINFIDFRMSGINELRSINKTRSTRFSTAVRRQSAVNIAKDRFLWVLLLKYYYYQCFSLSIWQRKTCENRWDMYLTNSVCFIWKLTHIHMVWHSFECTPAMAAIDQASPVLVCECNSPRPDWSGHGTTRVNAWTAKIGLTIWC